MGREINISAFDRFEQGLRRLGVYLSAIQKMEIPPAVDVPSGELDEKEMGDLLRSVAAGHNVLVQSLQTLTQEQPPDFGTEPLDLGEILSGIAQEIQQSLRTLITGGTFARGPMGMAAAGGGGGGDDYREVEAGELDIHWGKVKATWSSGNFVTVYPCSDHDGNNVGSAEIKVYIITPLGGTPENVVVAEDDIIGYLPFGDSEGLGICIKYGAGIPDGTNDQDILIWDTTNGWEADFGDEVIVGNKYKVLQVDSAGNWKLDFVRFHA